MTQSSTIGLEEILNHPSVMDAIADVNLELKDRMAYRPPVCDVFEKASTHLKTDAQYQFEIDRQARQQLSHIIGNTVQRVVGNDSKNAEFSKARGKSASYSRGGLHPADTM